MYFVVNPTSLSASDLLERLEDRPGFTVKEVRCQDDKADFQIIIPSQEQWREVLKQVNTIFGRNDAD